MYGSWPKGYFPRGAPQEITRFTFKVLGFRSFQALVVARAKKKGPALLNILDKAKGLGSSVFNKSPPLIFKLPNALILDIPVVVCYNVYGIFKIRGCFCNIRGRGLRPRFQRLRRPSTDLAQPFVQNQRPIHPQTWNRKTVLHRIHCLTKGDGIPVERSVC